MSNNLRKHIVSDKVKWIVIFVIALALIGAVITLFVKLDRQTTVTEIGAEAYVIGGLDESGEALEGNDSIVTRSAFTVNGLKVSIAEDANVTYALYFYDVDGEFISATEALAEDFNGTVPENADTAKIVITPTDDEDGVSLTEVLGYAGQVVVTVNR